MSYANMAGLPGVFGLYGLIGPVITYGCFGSSRQLGVGPVAVTSLLLGNGLADLYGSNSSPNHPKNEQLQATVNEAAIEVTTQNTKCLIRLKFNFRLDSWLQFYTLHLGFSNSTGLLASLATQS